MRFITITLIVHAPDARTGELKSTHERFSEVLSNARLADELGFDGFGVGERHERPFISSSPTVVLSHIAALTTRIRLFTAVTYETKFRPPLHEAEVWPQPLQRPIRVVRPFGPAPARGRRRAHRRAAPGQPRAVPVRHRPGAAPRDPRPAMGLGRRPDRRSPVPGGGLRGCGK
jgi:hypothetical protein